MTTLARQFIDQLAAGEAGAAKETIENVLSSKAFDFLDAYKQELAKNIYSGYTEDDGNTEETTEE